MNTNLEKLLQLPNVWQARRGPKHHAAYKTGFPTLDAALHLGGWPQGATTELLQAKAGHAELSLLLPALCKQQARAPWLVMIDPPFVPFAPALQAQGIELERLLIIYPKNLKDLLWSSTQCLQSGSCSSVLTWSHRTALADKDLRRLQQAALAGQCWHVLMRPDQARHQSSPSALRVTLERSAEGDMALEILKQRGGWSGQQLLIAANKPSSLTAPQQRPVFLAPLPPHPSERHQKREHSHKPHGVTSIVRAMPPLTQSRSTRE